MPASVPLNLKIFTSAALGWRKKKEEKKSCAALVIDCRVRDAGMDVHNSSRVLTWAHIYFGHST